MCYSHASEDIFDSELHPIFFQNYGIECATTVSTILWKILDICSLNAYLICIPFTSNTMVASNIKYAI